MKARKRYDEYEVAGNSKRQRSERARKELSKVLVLSEGVWRSKTWDLVFCQWIKGFLFIY